MRRIGAFEAKNKLAALLELAERGEEIVITKRGRAVAKLGPANARPDRDAAARAAADLRMLARRINLKDLSVEDWVRAGEVGKSR